MTKATKPVVHPFLNHPPANGATQPSVSEEAQRRPVHVGSVPGNVRVTNMDIDVTEACNLGCLYCFKSELYARHMSLHTMKRAFDWLVAASGDAGSINFNFMGGEPTMRWREIKDFAVWARARGQGIGKRVSFSMTSNLTLWNDEIRQFVDDYGFGVLMSIDGCPEVQDSQRPAKNGKPMSEVVEKWARSMLVTRPKSTARATLHPRYVKYLRRSVTYLTGLGFRDLTFAASEYDDWDAEAFGELQVQMGLIERDIIASFEAGDGFNLTVCRYMQNKVIDREHHGASVEFLKSPCGAGKGYLMVDYQGDIWPCHRFDGADFDAGMGGQFRMGNIFEAGFSYDLQKAFLDFDHSKIHKDSCAKCPANPVCGGFCPAANLSATGSIYTPHDAYCAWTQLMFASAWNVYQEMAQRGGDLFQSFRGSLRGAEDDGR